MIWTKAFWMGAGERGLKTFVQVFIAVLGLATFTPEHVITPAGFTQMPWATAALTATVATVLSLWTSLGASQFTAGTGGGTDDSRPAVEATPVRASHGEFGL